MPYQSKKERYYSPSIPCEFVHDAFQAFDLKGYSRAAILSHHGLDNAALNAPANRISVVDYASIVESIAAELNDGFLGFVDQPIPLKSFSVFAGQLAACRNMREVIQQVNRFYHLFSQQFRFEVDSYNNPHIIRLVFTETQNLDYRFIYQSILLVISRLVSWLLCDSIRPCLVRFSFQSTHLDPYLNYLFDCPIEFGRAANEIHFEPEVLASSCSTNLDQVQSMLRESTRMMLISDKPAPFTARVREIIFSCREIEWPTVEQVAASMDISTNLLWRKLKKEGTSYIDIREAMKRDFVLDLILKGHERISDISLKAGYADSSSFNKAFMKWTGMTPSAYRELVNAP